MLPGSDSISRQPSTALRLLKTYDAREGDALHLQISSIDSSFAGVWYDVNRRGLVVAATAGPQDAAAANATLQVLASNPAVGRAHVVASVQVAFSFNQLFQWRSELRSQAELAGIHTLGVDVQHNRILVGIRATAPSSIEVVAQRLGIPLAALDVHVGGGNDVAVQIDTSRVRGIPGGLNVWYKDTISNVIYKFMCTHGGTTTVNSHVGFVTAGHCESNLNGGTTGDWFYNNGSNVTSTTNLIGSVSINPAFFSCSLGSSCRYTDAEQVEYTPACQMNSNDCNAGKELVVTTTIGDSTSPGSLTQAAMLNTSGTATLISGWPIAKTGDSTGTTYGYIINTCVDELANGHWYLCQTTATGFSGKGDSGAPVFWIDSSSTPYHVYHVGIVGSTDSTRRRFAFSTWTAIGNELGVFY